MPCTNREVLALLAHLGEQLDNIDARLTDLEARIEHLEVYAL